MMIVIVRNGSKFHAPVLQISGIYKQGAIYVLLNKSFTVFKEGEIDDSSDSDLDV